jgi:predicted acyl esterase
MTWLSPARRPKANTLGFAAPFCRHSSETPRRLVHRGPRREHRVVSDDRVEVPAPPAKVSRPVVAMSDGTKLAVDVVLPETRATFPIVLLQTRYWRSFSLKVPDNPGRVPKGPREPIVEALVRAGYGVVVADVRGTGARRGDATDPG